jgi:GTP-binding protein HflX
MKEIFSTTEELQQAERALLITLEPRELPRYQAERYLSELRSLVDTLGLTTVHSAVVPVRELRPKYLVGSGKAQEIAELAEAHDAHCIIFDDTISPAQQRNWERLTGRCVIDRQEVILEIFSERARTKEAMLQVALARMEYSLPRLTRAWTHLSRQRGGTRGTRGEGETQLEMDRRVVLRKIDKLKRELERLHSQRAVRRKQRTGVPVPTGAIVGYTNAGKSSLLNALTEAEAPVENKLFATLDPTTKKTDLPGGTEVLFTDTVGFIRKLPHNLVDAFHSTLEEAVVADFLLIVLDASDPEVEHHLETTREVLTELEVGDTPSILVFNKIDSVSDRFSLEQLQADYPEALFLSVKEGTGIEALPAAIEELLFDQLRPRRFRIPLSRYDLASHLHRSGRVLSEEYVDNSVVVEAKVPEKTRGQLARYQLS